MNSAPFASWETFSEKAVTCSLADVLFDRNEEIPLASPDSISFQPIFQAPQAKPMSLPLTSAFDGESRGPNEGGIEQVAEHRSLEQKTSQRMGDIANNTSESLAQFFESVAPQAKRFAMSMTRRWCEAEELVQESFFRIAKVESSAHASEVANTVTPNSRKSYLFSTIRNLAIDRIRKSRTRPHVARELDSLAGPTRRNEVEQFRNLQRLEGAIESSFDAMPMQWSEALKLKVNGELTYNEIAEVLEATPDQVRGWIYRARKQLAAELNEQGLFGEDQ